MTSLHLVCHVVFLVLLIVNLVRIGRTEQGTLRRLREVGFNFDDKDDRFDMSIKQWIVACAIFSMFTIACICGCVCLARCRLRRRRRRTIKVYENNGTDQGFDHSTVSTTNSTKPNATMIGTSPTNSAHIVKDYELNDNTNKKFSWRYFAFLSSPKSIVVEEPVREITSSNQECACRRSSIPDDNWMTDVDLNDDDDTDSNQDNTKRKRWFAWGGNPFNNGKKMSLDF